MSSFFWKARMCKPRVSVGRGERRLRTPDDGDRGGKLRRVNDDDEDDQGGAGGGGGGADTV